MEKIPVIFHNLRGYDSHLLIQEIGKFDRKINVIPNNIERYMSFMLGNHLLFLDSFQLMSRSLPDDAFKYTSKEFKNPNELEFMKIKGVYPYDYMDSFQRLKETKLPCKEQFYSILNNEHISDNEYEHTTKVWELFHIKNLGEYHDLYLQTDVFDNFRKTSMQYYKLDPYHYFTSPGLGWDTMLKMTGIELELMSDMDMFQFIEKGMRGVIKKTLHINTIKIHCLRKSKCIIRRKQ